MIGKYLNGCLPKNKTVPPGWTGQSPRFLTVVPHAQLRWLPGLSHVPISDDPALVGRLIRHLIDNAETGRQEMRDRRSC